jgi:pimeloyl-ACP methyl ester carboxylesterase
MAKAFRRSFIVLTVLIALASAPTTSAQTPAREGFIDAGNGVKLYYRVLGTGANRLCSLTAAPASRATIWWTISRRWPAITHCWHMTSAAIGRSTLVSDSTALAAERYVDDLEAIRKHLGLDQLTLLGHSWGVVPRRCTRCGSRSACAA